VFSWAPFDCGLFDVPAVCGLADDGRRVERPPIAVPGRIIDFGSSGGKNEFFEGFDSTRSS
jgi:hypothetical protein